MAEGEDPEKRFERIMDKLYQFPKQKPQPPSGASSSHKWKPSSRGSTESAVVSFKARAKEAAPQPCRPWDRGDLIRRLSTFKAMTWFGKPKVAGPVNCARRGWVNIDMDTISCEACGSRLFFSTPSSWSFQQVEKAAAVFSLKLDNGHKLLCPWIDNICDESLASFPSTPTLELIEAYKERSKALLQLSALPVISQSAFSHMKCEELDILLKRSTVACTLDKSTKLIGGSVDDGDIVPDDNTSDFYFKAQKLISLCGWELRLLPYVVGCEDSLTQNETNGSSDYSGMSSGGKNVAVVVYTGTTSTEAGGEKERDSDVGTYSDPASAALDCKLCGASVGLWSFDSTPCPLECFTLVNYPEANVQNDSSDQDSQHVGKSAIDTSNKNVLQLNRSAVTSGHLNLKLSIAGGVPPARQHFRPRISLPIISRHLRAQLGLTSEVGIAVANKNHTGNSANNNLSSENNKADLVDLVLTTVETNNLKRKRNEEENCINDEDYCGVPSKLKTVQLGESISETGLIGGLPSEETPWNNLEIVDACKTVHIDESEFSRDMVISSSAGIEFHHEGEETGILISEETTSTLSPIQPFDSVTNGDSEACDDNLLSQLLDASVSDFTNMESGPELGLLAGSDAVTEPDKGITCQTSCTDGDASNKNIGRSENSVLENELSVPFQETGGKFIPAERNTAKAFDPVRSHRPFCPWIASTESGKTPGWKRTLIALAEAGNSPSTIRVRTKLFSETEDPIFSLRKLFETPKRSKHS